MEGLPGHKHCQVCSEHAAVQGLLCLAENRAPAASSTQGPLLWPGWQGLSVFHKGRKACWGDMFTGGLTDKKLPVSLWRAELTFLGDAKSVSKTRVSTAMQGML